MKICIRVQSIMSLRIHLKPTLHIAAWHWKLQNSIETQQAQIHVNIGKQKSELEALAFAFKMRKTLGCFFDR